MDNCNVRLVDLPVSIKGFVKKEDDFYTVVINSRLSHDCQMKCFEHEMKHIMRKDFEKSDVDGIETKAHER